MRKYIYLVVVIGLILIGFFIGEHANNSAPVCSNTDTIKVINRHTDTVYKVKYLSDRKKGVIKKEIIDSVSCSPNDSVTCATKVNVAEYDTVLADTSFSLHVRYFTSAPIDTGAYFLINWMLKEKEIITEHAEQIIIKDSGAWYKTFWSGFLSAIVSAAIYLILR